jgi:hypothetical protein
MSIKFHRKLHTLLSMDKSFRKITALGNRTRVFKLINLQDHQTKYSSRGISRAEHLTGDKLKRIQTTLVNMLAVRNWWVKFATIKRAVMEP